MSGSGAEVGDIIDRVAGASEGRRTERPIDRAISRLRARGDRVTVPRRAVLEALDAAAGHPNADWLIDRIAHAHPGVHRASVYRSLEFLIEAGLVNHVHVPHGAVVYHLCADDDVDHAHVVCRRCGRVVDVSGLLDEPAARLARDHGLALDITHVALSGHCVEGCG